MCSLVLLFFHKRAGPYIQWASRKKDIIRSLIPTYLVPCAKPLFSNWNSFDVRDFFRNRVRNMVKSPKREGDDGQCCNGYDVPISSMPDNLKDPIGFKYPPRLIRPIRLTGNYHAN